VSGFYAYLVARGDCGVDTNPVPRGVGRTAFDVGRVGANRAVVLQIM